MASPFQGSRLRDGARPALTLLTVILVGDVGRRLLAEPEISGALYARQSE